MSLSDLEVEEMHTVDHNEAIGVGAGVGVGLISDELVLSSLKSISVPGFDSRAGRNFGDFPHDSAR